MTAHEPRLRIYYNFIDMIDLDEEIRKDKEKRRNEYRRERHERHQRHDVVYSLGRIIDLARE